MNPDPDIEKMKALMTEPAGYWLGTTVCFVNPKSTQSGKCIKTDASAKLENGGVHETLMNKG